MHSTTEVTPPAPPARIYPYSSLELIAPGLWRVVGTMALPLPRTMYVYRLPSGGLLLDSVVAMHETDMRSLERLGRPEVIVVPHPKHLMDAGFYMERYPEAVLLGEPDAQAKRPDLRFTDTVTNGLLRYGVTPHAVPGMKMAEVVLELPLANPDAPHDGERNTRALLFADLINRPEDSKGILASLALRLFGPKGDGGVARILKLTQIADVEAVRGFLQTLSHLPAIALIAGCHGEPVTAGCSAWLAEAAAQL